MNHGSLSWYVARASGLVGWSLLTASVLWGLAMSTRAPAFRRRPRPAWMLDLHRFLGGLAVIFTGVHVGALLTDTWVHFDLASVLVPFASSWRPGAVAWGVAGLYLLAAVELTSLVRARMPLRAWHAVHLASLPLFLTATVHGLTAGTDAGSWLFVLAATAAVLAVGGLTALRVAQASAARGALVAAVAARPAPVLPVTGSLRWRGGGGRR